MENEDLQSQENQPKRVNQFTFSGLQVVWRVDSSFRSSFEPRRLLILERSKIRSLRGRKERKPAAAELHRGLCKATKTHRSSTSNEAELKLLNLVIRDVANKVETRRQLARGAAPFCDSVV